MASRPSQLVRQARRIAGLTQRALARRARVSLSVVVRIERAPSNPKWETVQRLLDAAGFHLHTELVARPVSVPHMLQEVARILSLTPEQRLEEVKNMSRLVARQPT